MGNPVPTTRHFKCESLSCDGHFDGSMGMSFTMIMGTRGRSDKSKRENLTIEMQHVESPDARRRLRQAIELVLFVVVREREPTK